MTETGIVIANVNATETEIVIGTATATEIAKGDAGEELLPTREIASGEGPDLATAMTTTAGDIAPSPSHEIAEEDRGRLANANIEEIGKCLSNVIN